jgi:ribosomal protein S14
MKQYKSVQVGKVRMRLHRYLMECFLGRKLKPFELVHHIDGDVLNNNIENLKIVTRQNHIKEHGNAGHKTFKYKINENDVIERFKTQTLQSIANKYGCSLGAITQIVYKKHLIKKPKVYCVICGERAFYRKKQLCKKHYLREWAHAQHK